MMFGMLITFNSHHSQWIPMIMSGAASFLVSTTTSRFLSSEISSILSALALGVVANTIARRNDITAIPSIFAGILWLVPGTVGVLGAFEAFDGGGANFAMVIIARTISITIGMYIANIVVFPMNPLQKIEAENESMAV